MSFFWCAIIHTTASSERVLYVDAFSSPLSRIKRSGGFITWNSLGQPNVNGRLAMTRSIGDFDLKDMGVIAEPETKKISVSPARLVLLQL